MGVTPVRDVISAGGRWVALSEWPWLRCDARSFAGRWLRIVYAAGLLDPLKRPMLRFWTPDGHEDEILPAALHGRAIWIGRAPDDARELWISPTSQAGPFSFRLESLEVFPGWRALIGLEAAAPTRAGRYLLARATGRAALAKVQARRAFGVTPLSRYAQWREARLRAFEPDFDLPADGAALRFAVIVDEGRDRQATLDSLCRQTYPGWSLASDLTDFCDDDLVLSLAPGDVLADYALAAFASEARRRPEINVFYADEDQATPTGHRLAPALKPDWSPLRQAALPYLGAPVAMRARIARSGAGLDLPNLRAAHVRRVLLTRPAGQRETPAPIDAMATASDIATSPVREWAASIIIPTRDRLELLSKCVASLELRSPGARIEIIIVDNGSREPAMLAYLREFADKPGRLVIDAPGPFNFSALSNLGARAASTPFLLFLNNDVEAASDDWLARLLTLAAQGQVGAVGPKLLYPDGALQHGGIVLGVDGLAGHVQRRLAGDDPGYLGSLAAMREVGAVTGACLAVEARKFVEVGGFDEVNLPIEYNDLDLCLRLTERGYACVFEPRARLIHHESASRGTNRLLDGRYAGELAYIRERWASHLRDDPTYHPALSLDSLSIALG